MRISTLLARNLGWYWRTNLAVLLGVTTAAGVLGGALLVGDSVRSSLRDLLLARLGSTDVVVSRNGFFREEAAADQEISPDGRTYGVEYLERRPEARVERAAITVLSRIGAGQERRHRIGVSIMQFDAGEANGLRPFCRVREERRQRVRKVADMRQIDIRHTFAIALR